MQFTGLFDIYFVTIVLYMAGMMHTDGICVKVHHSTRSIVPAYTMNNCHYRWIWRILYAHTQNLTIQHTLILIL